MTGNCTKLLTQWSRVLPAKIKNPQLVKKFPEFYETRRFITVFTRARHLSLSSVRSIQSTSPSHLLNICFNFILPSTHRSSKWSLSLRFPHQNALRISPTHTCCTPCLDHLNLFLIYFITRVIFGAENRS